jgi:hypothetical protein
MEDERYAGGKGGLERVGPRLRRGKIELYHASGVAP